MGGGPCTPWITAEDIGADDRVCGEPSDEVLASLAAESSEKAYILLGRKFAGPCTATVRPVLRGEGCCSPCGSSEIALHNPVISIDEVLIDGELVTDWYVRDGYILCRNRRDWPSGQRLDLPTTDARTFAITYTFAEVPPESARQVALEIAVMTWIERQTNPAYALPVGTTSVSRQGMSLTIDPERAVEYPMLAQAIATFNPNHELIPADVYWGDPPWDLVVVWDGQPETS
jgi:hypothetical protein